MYTFYNSIIIIMMMMIFILNNINGDADTCCTECIGKYSTTSVDSVDWNQCNAKKTPCCFQCGQNWAQPTPYQGSDSKLSYNKDGEAEIPSGNYIFIQWNSAKEIHYRNYGKNEKKNSQITSADKNATLDSRGYHSLCPSAPGKLYYRGFNGCEASIEYSITITEGNSTCEAAPIIKTDEIAKVTGTTATSASSTNGNKDKTVECNLNRASINKDGVCECVSDWAGPPTCTNLPLWKWLITIGGGVAAAFSIAMSVHAFMKHRKTQKEANNQRFGGDSTITKTDMETLRVSPHISSSPTKQGPYYEQNSLKDDPMAENILRNNNIMPYDINHVARPHQECTL